MHLWPWGRRWPEDKSTIVSLALALGMLVMLGKGGKQGRQPHLWDGKAAQRIVEVLVAQLATR